MYNRVVQQIIVPRVGATPRECANALAACTFARLFCLFRQAHGPHLSVPLVAPSSRLSVNLSVCTLVTPSCQSPLFILLPKYRFSVVKMPSQSPIFHELLTLKSLF